MAWRAKGGSGVGLDFFLGMRRSSPRSEMAFPLWLFRPARREFKEHGCKRRQRQNGRGVKSVRGSRLGQDAAEIAHIGAAVEAGVGIQSFAPVPRVRQANAITQARHRREIADG